MVQSITKVYIQAGISVQQGDKKGKPAADSQPAGFYWENTFAPCKSRKDNIYFIHENKVSENIWR